MSNNTSIINVPIEVIERILVGLSFELYSISRTCKTFYNIIQNPTIIARLFLIQYGHMMALCCGILKHPATLTPAVVSNLLMNPKVLIPRGFFASASNSLPYSVHRDVKLIIQNRLIDIYGNENLYKAQFTTVFDLLNQIYKSTDANVVLKTHKTLNDFIDETEFIPISLGIFEPSRYGVLDKEYRMVFLMSLVATDILEKLAAKGFYIVIMSMNALIVGITNYAVGERIKARQTAEAFDRLIRLGIIDVSVETFYYTLGGLKRAKIAEYFIDILSHLVQFDASRFARHYLQRLRPQIEDHVAVFPLIRKIYLYWGDEGSIYNFYNQYSLSYIGKTNIRETKKIPQTYDIRTSIQIYEWTVQTFTLNHEYTTIAFDVVVLAMAYPLQFGETQKDPPGEIVVKIREFVLNGQILTQLHYDVMELSESSHAFNIFTRLFNAQENMDLTL